MTTLYLENKTTKRKYRVVRFDKEENRIYLKGEYGEFDHVFDKEQFKKMGYELVRVEEDEEQDAA